MRPRFHQINQPENQWAPQEHGGPPRDRIRMSDNYSAYYRPTTRPQNERPPPALPVLPPTVHSVNKGQHKTIMSRHANPLGDVANYGVPKAPSKHLVGSSVYHRQSHTGTPSQRVNKEPVRKPTDDALIQLFRAKNIDLSQSRKLGCGRYSKVITAQLIPSQHTIAIKVINTLKVTSEFRSKFLPREVECWKKLMHPNLVRILGHYEAMHYVFLTMEFGSGGDLLTTIQKNGPMPDRQASHCVSQIVAGLYEMHRRGIAHRDLKLENVIVFPDNLYKIADFGFAKEVNQEMSHTYCGSKSYSPPEILAGEPYSPYKSDIWSVGVIAFIVVTDCMPFRENQPNHKIVDSQRRRNYAFPSKLQISAHCRYTIDSMLTFSWSQRPDILRCQQLPWICPHFPNRHRDNN